VEEVGPGSERRREREKKRRSETPAETADADSGKGVGMFVSSLRKVFLFPPLNFPAGLF
jgi:hypothetical protein